MDNTQDLKLFSMDAAATPITTGFDYALQDRDDLADRSRQTYLERVGHFMAWLDTHNGFDDALFSPAGRDRAVEAYLTAAVQERGVVGRTVNLTLSALAAFYTWLGFGAPTTPRAAVAPITPRTLSRSEERALLYAAAEKRGTRAYAMIALVLDIGLRKSEITTVQLAGLDLAHRPGRLTIGPTGSSDTRSVPLQPRTHTALRAWITERRRWLRNYPPQTALFLTAHAPHRPLTPRTVDYAIRTVGEKAGLDISPGTLRATAEQRMLHEGLSSNEVAARLGQQAPDPDRIRALCNTTTPRPRTRLALTHAEQLVLFGNIVS